MSRYTMQLRNAFVNDFDLGLSNYPIFDENYREVLNKKIIDHYFFYEIEFETFGMFKHYMQVKMNEIMPKFNMLYTKQKELFDSINFENVETFVSSNNESNTNTLNGESNTTSQTTDHDINKYSDTPQNDITNLDKYLTSATINDASASGTNKNTNISSGSGERLSDGSYTKKILNAKDGLDILTKIKDTFVDIDVEIINSLDDLFFKLF